MKYSVYRVEDDPRDNSWFDQFVGYRVLVSEGCYLFYMSSYAQPQAIYPVNHFYVIKED